MTSACRPAGTVSMPQVVELTDADRLAPVAALFRRVWGTNDSDQPVHPDLMRALAHTGNYVAGAYLGDALVGASVGFLTGDGRLHSHVTAVAPGQRGGGVGRALKWHQRDWALARGIGRICWTFDPLVRRNAYFNLTRLGARPVEYLVDFYGPMDDGLNGRDESDRLEVEWDLTAGAAPAVEPQPRDLVLLGVGSGDRPLPGADPAASEPAERLLVATPPDVTRLRRTDPDAAVDWRRALRAALVPALGAGYRIAGVTRTGWYLLERS